MRAKTLLDLLLKMARLSSWCQVLLCGADCICASAVQGTGAALDLMLPAWPLHHFTLSGDFS